MADLEHYLARMDAMIGCADDIKLAAGVLAELARDRAALTAGFTRFMDDFDREMREEDSRLSQNVLLLRSVAAQSANRAYLPALSYHAPARARSIANTTICSIVCPVNAAATVHRYRLPADWAIDVFVPGCTLELVDRGILAPGEVMAMAPGPYCYLFEFAEPTLIVKLQSQASFGAYEWSFDSDTLAAWNCISTEPLDSYVQHLCMAARGMQDARLAAPLHLMTAHPRHHVRWAALQALGALSADQATQALRAMVNDAHPHVARRARELFSTLN